MELFPSHQIIRYSSSSGYKDRLSSMEVYECAVVKLQRSS